MGGIFRPVKIIEIKAAMTIAESATLNIGQCGSCIQSMTCPRKTPGSRKIRSTKLPRIPPITNPKTTAQPLDVICGEK